MPSMFGRRLAPSSEHVNRWEQSNQHYGVKHEKQGVAGGEVQCRQNQDDEEASEYGGCIVAVVTTVHELKYETAESMNMPTTRGITSPYDPFESNRRRARSGKTRRPRPPRNR